MEMKQGSCGRKDPRITDDLRLKTLAKLISDLRQQFNPLDDKRITGRLRVSASRFEIETFASAQSLEEYLAILTERPITAILPSGDFISGQVLNTVRSNGAGSSSGNASPGTLQAPSNNVMPSGNSPQQTSGTVSVSQNNYAGQQALSTEVAPLQNIPGSLPMSAQQITTLNQNKQQQSASISNQHLPTQPHPGLRQPRRNYQPRRQQQIRNQSSTHQLTAANNSGGQISQPGGRAMAATGQMMTNSMMGLTPNQFWSEVFRKQQMDLKSNVQHVTNVPLSISGTRQNLSSENQSIQESQVAGTQGSRECPIMLSEGSTEWHDIAFRVLQRCKDECWPVILKIQEKIDILHPQANSEEAKNMASEIRDMANFINMQRSSMVHITRPSFYTQIEKLYKFARGGMRNKYPLLFSGPGQEQTVLPAVTDINHTQQQRQKHLLQQQGATSHGNHQFISPPQGINASVVVTQSNSHNQRSSKKRRLNAEANKAYADQLFKWNFDEMVVLNFYGIDDLIDLEYHMLRGIFSGAGEGRASGRLNTRDV